MTTVCVTNSVDDLTSCTYRGSHTEECDGNEWAWIEKRHREEATGKACRGCEPRKAQNGFTCRACYTAITAALAGAPELIRALTGVDRAVMRDSAGRSSSSAGFVPIPATQLAVDELSRYLALCPGSADEWVATLSGAVVAVRFARAFRSAAASHPTRETSHKIKRTRCPQCEQLTLIWHPPAFKGMDVVVRCSDPKCGRAIDQDSLEVVAGIESSTSRMPGLTLGADVPESEPFDPTNPDHLALIGVAP